jgi:hypothetical protein
MLTNFLGKEKINCDALFRSFFSIQKLSVTLAAAFLLRQFWENNKTTNKMNLYCQFF